MSNIREELHQKTDSIKIHPWIAVGIQQSGYIMITNLVCNYYDINIEDVFKKTRKRNIVWARQVIMYFCHMHINKQTLAEVGFKCGNKDHATVLHAKKVVMNVTDVDKKIYNELVQLEKKIVLTKNRFSENI